MSKHSPGPVEDSELLSRFVFCPIHVGKKDKLLPSLFSHVDNKGCSIQREDIASNDELRDFVKSFLVADADRKWFGVVQGKSEVVRKLNVTTTSNRNLCIYDTAEELNPAHAEFCKTSYVIEEADRLALRSEIFKAFGNREVIPPEEYRQGSILKAVTSV